MKLKEIQDLIRFISRTGLDEVTVEVDGVKITVKANKYSGKEQEALIAALKNSQQAQVLPPATGMPIQVPQTQPSPVVEVSKTESAPEQNTEDESKYVTIKSPVLGTFYRKPSPDKENFVEVGSEVKTGDVVCVVEAMKLFNEIESEVSGKIVKVLVDDVSPVEYDQPLYLVDPS